ncbi:hypothetical protein CCP2SC5_2330002 [Azospirillaceae bacterium]
MGHRWEYPRLPASALGVAALLFSQTARCEDKNRFDGLYVPAENSAGKITGRMEVKTDESGETLITAGNSSGTQAM